MQDRTNPGSGLEPLVQVAREHLLDWLTRRLRLVLLIQFSLDDGTSALIDTPT